MKQTHWIGKPSQDIWGILMPPFLALLMVVLWQPNSAVDPMWWLLLVVCVDVAHVYSTLFRTYWSRATRERTGSLLWMIPLSCFVIGVLVHMYSPMWFWRLLAYAAVWHFVRQQYGFLRLYERKETLSNAQRWISGSAIYAATLYPILYWHVSGDRVFHWMVEGDFFALHDASKGLLDWAFVAYVGLAGVYIVAEVRRIVVHKAVNWPKLILIVGTYVSWYFGIVHYNGDWAFTALNVISHGIPYLVLIWITDGNRVVRTGKRWKAFIVFLMLVLVLAFTEEAFWDSLIWRDHPVFFEWMYPESPIGDRAWLNLLVPLLALPQLVHYVLDGFIWKRPKTLVHNDTAGI
jgi:hypothetical protein